MSMAQKIQQAQAQTDKANATAEKAKKDFASRESDINAGKQFGQEVLGEEGLGRLGSDAEIQSTLDRFKQISETGMSSQESEAQKAQAFKGIDSATQTGLRSLQSRFARSGVKGAVAGQQLMQREMSGAQQKADASTNLFLKSEEVKRNALENFSSRLGEVKTFDLGQAAKEKDIVMQSGLGFAQIGSAERTANYAAEQSAKASVASARASRPSCFLGSNLVELNSGKKVRFDSLEPGMVLKNNNLIEGISKHLAVDSLYNYGDVMVTGEHFVVEGEGYLKVKDSSKAKKAAYPVDTLYVYNIITDEGTVELNGITFADWNDDDLEEYYGNVQEIYEGKVRSGSLS